MGSERETPARRLGLVVLNWNGQAVLPACLASLEAAAAASRHRATLLLVDNASTDGSADWAARAHPAWELLRLAENRGFAAGMNAGLALLLARDLDCLCALNNDIEADPGLLDPLVADLEAEARRGAVCPRIHYADRRERIWYAGGRVSRLSTVSRHLGLRQPAAGRWLEPADTDYLTGCCLLGRAEFWRSTGGFDERFGLYGEDVDLSLRARALGWRLRYQPAALLYHRVGFASGGQLAAGKLRAQRRAAAALVARHVPRWRRPWARAAWAWHWSRALLAALGRGEAGVLRAALGALRRESKA
ncbi:glycosyltransferase family 2 protein [bacterium]|nr:glycosyltransferase family 2 protein [bacterium]